MEAPAEGKRQRASGRERILAAIRAAAVTEFSLHGLRGASTQAIAERAGLSKPQLHYYISGKEQLYEALLQSVLDAWARLFVFDAGSDDPSDVLAAYIRKKLEYAFDKPELSRIYTREVLSGGPMLQKHWPRAAASAHAKVAQIEGWIRRGAIRPLDARLLLVHIWAVTQHYADFSAQMQAMFGGIDSPTLAREHIVREVTDFVLRGCLPGNA